jgi:thiol:disulfide interchange protein DsbA
MIMRFLRLLLASAALMLNVAAVNAAPLEGVDYSTLANPVRPAEMGKKVEVIEFFMYSCPHCNALEPLMAEWVKKNADKINFHRIHFPRSESDPLAHAYLTLEAMNKLDLVHDRLFRAMHVEHNRLATDDAILDLVTKAGIDKAKYLEYFNSFSVQSKMKRASALIASYKVESAPTLVIDGRFVTSPSQAGRPGQPEAQSQAATLAVMDYLVAKVAAEKSAKK